jgi:hypothetical protein
MPINRDPDPTGNLAIHLNEVTLHGKNIRPPVALYIGKPDRAALFDEYAGRRYKSHFATCGQAAKWRGEARQERE